MESTARVVLMEKMYFPHSLGKTYSLKSGTRMAQQEGGDAPLDATRGRERRGKKDRNMVIKRYNGHPSTSTTLN